MTRLPSLGPRGEGWFAIQLLLLGAIVAAGLVAGGLSGPMSGIAMGIGVVLLAVGLGQVALGIRQLGSALTPMPRPREGAPLVEDGIFRFVRHPIYGGLILAAFGWSMVMASPLGIGLSLVLLGFFQLKSRREEAWLLARDERYADYAARTRRFVPWVL